jgi:hypothetical protein
MSLSAGRRTWKTSMCSRLITTGTRKFETFQFEGSMNGKYQICYVTGESQQSQN